MSLILITAILCSVFIGISYIVTENNAKYILSGYNTLSEAEQKQIDLKGYLSRFRKFSLFLGISLFVLVMGLSRISINAAGSLLVIYPICAYGYFSVVNIKYFSTTRKQTRWGVAILAGVLVFVIVMLYLGFKSDKLEVTGDRISISGVYSESIVLSEIDNISLTSLPQLSFKSNGFALGEIKKGYFKTADDEEVKLILNNNHRPLLLIKKKNGEKIFYSDGAEDNRKVFEELKNSFAGHEGLFVSDN